MIERYTYKTSSTNQQRSGNWKYVLILICSLTILGAQPITQEGVFVSASEGSPNPVLENSLSQIREYISVKENASKPRIYARNYLLMNTENAELLVAEKADEKISIASTTKMTTALVAKTYLNLDQVLTVSSEPPLIEGSKIGLKSGEKITVRDLIKGLLISSGNDAAFALAEGFANEPGNYAKFVDKMNEYVASKGLVSTNFADPAGLDDIGYSTPRELAHIGKLLLRDSFLRDVVVTANATVSSTDGLIQHELKNSNRLVAPTEPLYMSKAFGIKTGFTLQAGHCLVAAYDWNGKNLVGVVMNTTESTISASAKEMNKLFNWAENSLEIGYY